MHARCQPHSPGNGRPPSFTPGLSGGNAGGGTNLNLSMSELSSRTLPEAFPRPFPEHSPGNVERREDAGIADVADSPWWMRTQGPGTPAPRLVERERAEVRGAWPLSQRAG